MDYYNYLLRGSGSRLNGNWCVFEMRA